MQLRFLVTALLVGGLPTAAVAEPQGEPDPDRPRGGYVLVPPDEHRSAEGGSTVSKILFVNRCPGGCVVRPGQDDARANISSIVSSQVTLSEFAHSDEVWNQTIQCLREVYAPYDVEITTEDPGEELFHHEAILAGTSAEAGLGPNVGGVAPLAFDCSPKNNVISFSFANSTAPDWVTLCWTVAQESAHAYGLDHVYDCSDPLTYIPNCGQKFFRDKLLPCGEFNERACQCTGNTQNSHRKLLSIFGEGTLPSPPEVSLILPSDGESVAGGFSVYANASHPRGIGKIEYYFNGWLWGTVPGHPYSKRGDPYRFDTPGNLPDGIIDIEVRAYNDLNVPASINLTVTKGSPCTSADQCLDGQSCNDGRCAWPPPEGELGDACERDQDCKSLLCPSDGTNRFCSETCFPGVNNQCPSGFDCIPAGADAVCWPAGEGEGGGCCSVGDERRAPLVEIGLFALLIAFVTRRRRRA